MAIQIAVSDISSPVAEDRRPHESKALYLRLLGALSAQTAGSATPSQASPVRTGACLSWPPQHCNHSNASSVQPKAPAHGPHRERPMKRGLQDCVSRPSIIEPEAPAYREDSDPSGRGSLSSVTRVASYYGLNTRRWRCYSENQVERTPPVRKKDVGVGESQTAEAMECVCCHRVATPADPHMRLPSSEYERSGPEMHKPTMSPSPAHTMLLTDSQAKSNGTTPTKSVARSGALGVSHHSHKPDRHERCRWLLRRNRCRCMSPMAE